MENEKNMELNDEALDEVVGGKSIYDNKITPVASWVQYTIKTGDSLGALAQKYGVTVKTLQEKNKIADANKIKAGQTIMVPKK